MLRGTTVPSGSTTSICTESSSRGQVYASRKVAPSVPRLHCQPLQNQAIMCCALTTKRVRLVSSHLAAGRAQKNQRDVTIHLRPQPSTCRCLWVDFSARCMRKWLLAATRGQVWGNKREAEQSLRCQHRRASDLGVFNHPQLIGAHGIQFSAWRRADTWFESASRGLDKRMLDKPTKHRPSRTYLVFLYAGL